MTATRQAVLFSTRTTHTSVMPSFVVRESVNHSDGVRDTSSSGAGCRLLSSNHLASSGAVVRAG